MMTLSSERVNTSHAPSICHPSLLNTSLRLTKRVQLCVSLAHGVTLPCALTSLSFFSRGCQKQMEELWQKQLIGEKIHKKHPVKGA